MSDEKPAVDFAAIRAKASAIAAAEAARAVSSPHGNVAGEIVESIASFRAVVEKRGRQVTPRPCPVPPREYREPIPDGETRCDRVGHFAAVEGVIEATGPCPFVAVAAEEKRLAGILTQLRKGKGADATFDAYDPTRHPAAREALTAMREYASGRPPQTSVLLIGSLGLGKTHLLIASHFSLLAAGLDSRYVTTPDLRALFRDAGGFEGKARDEARATLAAICRSPAVHVDDLGDVEGDERKRGEFSEQFKSLRDSSPAAWAVASNCDYDAAARHPDIGRKVLDRLVFGAIMVPMSGDSQRAPREVRR